MPKKPKRKKAAKRRNLAKKSKSKVKFKSKQKGKPARKRNFSTKTAYRVDQSFGLFKELRALVIKAVPESFPQLERKLKRLGRIKLAVATGAFLNIVDSRIDLLLVGDNIQLERLTSVIKDLESELGREIRYVTLSVPEFRYRYEMYDRFLRDILDSPHEKVIKRIKLQHP